jgi:hypothetical protein
MMLTGAHSTDAWIIPQLRYSTAWEATPSCPALGLAPALTTEGETYGHDGCD